MNYHVRNSIEEIKQVSPDELQDGGDKLLYVSNYLGLIAIDRWPELSPQMAGRVVARRLFRSIDPGRPSQTFVTLGAMDKDQLDALVEKTLDALIVEMEALNEIANLLGGLDET